MKQELRFESGFPEDVRNEYEHVISLICRTDGYSVKIQDAYNSEKETYLLLDGTRIRFPYRIYCPDDDQVYQQLTDTEKRIYSCIFTRSSEGHARERHVRNVCSGEIPEWCFPYIVRASADYVYEVVNAIFECLKLRDNRMLQEFCRNNPEVMRTNYRRMCSYWHEYYRINFPDVGTYTGAKLFSECLSSNSSL